MTGLIGSNDVIDRLRATGDTILKTHTKRGVIWHYARTLKPVETPVCERLVRKGILVAREPSEQSFELAEGWR